MPPLVRPPLPEGMDRAVSILGNRLRVAIIVSLRNSGPASRTDIARRVGVPSDNVRFHLNLLERDGIVYVYPPRSDPEVRFRRYYLHEDQVDALLADMVRGLSGA